MKFESVTGKASIYVYQDFGAQILVYNMIQDIRKSADEGAISTGQNNGNKYPMHTNENITIGLFKESMIKILLESETTKRVKKFEELQQEMECYVLPIRKLPSKARKKIALINTKIIKKIVFKKLTFYLRGNCELFLMVL